MVTWLDEKYEICYVEIKSLRDSQGNVCRFLTREYDHRNNRILSNRLLHDYISVNGVRYGTDEAEKFPNRLPMVKKVWTTNEYPNDTLTSERCYHIRTGYVTEDNKKNILVK